MTRSTKYFLTTQRLGFRQWTTGDLPLALALWGDPKVTALMGGPFSEATVQKKLAAEMASMANHQVQYWPLFLLASDEHVGCAGLHPYRDGGQASPDRTSGTQTDDRIYELGYHLRREYWGQGLAEEAGRAIVAYSFEGLAVKGLFAGHHPENAASRRVLEKLGFTFTHEEFYPPTGNKHPSYLLMRPVGTTYPSSNRRSNSG
jgi:ribosomal-protein-alanine N-acetyltransferase